MNLPKAKQLDQFVDALAVLAIVIVAYFGQYDIAIYGLVSIALGKRVLPSNKE